MHDTIFNPRIEYLERKLERKLTHYEWHKFYIYFKDIECQQSFYETVLHVVYGVLEEAEMSVDDFKSITI